MCALLDNSLFTKDKYILCIQHKHQSKSAIFIPNNDFKRRIFIYQNICKRPKKVVSKYVFIFFKIIYQ